MTGSDTRNGEDLRAGAAAETGLRGIGPWIRAIPDRFRRVTTSTVYNSQLDGLRFLAIMPVVIYHISLRGSRLYKSEHGLSAENRFWKELFPHGDVGVVLFFFISGFIIAYPFLKWARAERDRPRVGDFYLRRLMRLAPAYFIALVGCYLMLSITGFTPTDAPRFNAVDAPLHHSLIASLLYGHGLWFAAAPRLDPPLWSLEVEIQFYVIAPFLLIAYASIRNALVRRWICVVAIVAALYVGHWRELIDAMSGRHEWTIFGYAHFFLVGLLVADIGMNSDRVPRRGVLGDVALLIGFIVLMLTGVPKSIFNDYVEAMRDTIQIAAILAIYFGSVAGNLSGRFLGSRWITLIGGMCYSIYLTHVPLIQLVAEIIRIIWIPDSLAMTWVVCFTLMLPAVLIAGLVFYLLIEYPTMDKRWPAQLSARVKGIFSPIGRRQPET